MKLSKKLKIFSEFFTAFLKYTINFEHFHFKKQDEFHRLSLYEIIDYEVRAYVNV